MTFSPARAVLLIQKGHPVSKRAREAGRSRDRSGTRGASPEARYSSGAVDGSLPSREPSRYPDCVASWPDCREGEYNPKCCRFPKSCSCEIVEICPDCQRDIRTHAMFDPPRCPVTIIHWDDPFA